MHKLWVSTYKEFLLLIRDWGGLAILFLMPLVLLIVITLVQDSTFKTVKETKIPILLVDLDDGTVSKNIHESFSESRSLEIIKKISETEAIELVQKGDYQLAIIIPKGLSRDLNKKVTTNVDGILARFGLGEEKDTISKTLKIEPKEIRLYFDPATQQSFKSSIKNGIDKMISKIEIKTIYNAFQEQLTDDASEIIFDTKSFITFTEIVPGADRNYIPNSTQHNVPAWTLFAIFFIILPLSINMIKEKNQGTFIRLRTQPVSYLIVLGGKTLIFLIVCLIQFSLMLLIGIYLFPSLGLPQLDVHDKLPLLYLTAFFAGLAAIGLGLLIGTIAKSQEQSAPFGATLVVILAALGGVWVPVFVMPPTMQLLSNISPMNWGLNAFYDVFLRNAGVSEIIPEISLLLGFFVLSTLIAVIYYEQKNAV